MNVVVHGAVVLSTHELVTVARNAIEDGLEYVLDAGTAQVTDPSLLAVHVLVARAVLDQRAGSPCKPYVRCLLMVKTVSNTGHTQRHLDVRLRDYLQLEPVDMRDTPSSTFQRTFSEHDLRADDRSPS